MIKPRLTTRRFMVAVAVAALILSRTSVDTGLRFPGAWFRIGHAGIGVMYNSDGLSYDLIVFGNFHHDHPVAAVVLKDGRFSIGVNFKDRWGVRVYPLNVFTPPPM